MSWVFRRSMVPLVESGIARVLADEVMNGFLAAGHWGNVILHIHSRPWFLQKMTRIFCTVLTLLILFGMTMGNA